VSLPRFWLDGGYDRDLVEGCRAHPDHEWVTLDLGELDPEDHEDEHFTVCHVCGVPRCGESDVDGCDLPRHHEEAHRTKSGASWPIGGNDPRRPREPSPAPLGAWS
jgi:hypothetical protein